MMFFPWYIARYKGPIKIVFFFPSYIIRYRGHKACPFIPAKPLYNRDIVSVHFNNFYYMGICNKLTRHLSMLTYIYLNVDEC